MERLWAECRALMPGGVSSPIRSGYMIDVEPPILAHGKGALVYDVSNLSYIDLCMSWGALLHGHAHKDIVQESINAIQSGSTFGATTEAEADLARIIRLSMPSIEQVRFVSSGTEATMSAVRLARAATGRNDIVKCIGNYHGHADQFLIQAGSGVQRLSCASSQGIPKSFIQHTLCVPYNDENAIEEVLKRRSVAAVLIEPVCANMGVVLPKQGYLQTIRDLCTQYGTLLIFDEVITGFRLGLGGAQEVYRVMPDITCLGKIMGGGFPAAAFGAKRELMQLLSPQGSVYQAGTLSGNPVAMRAGCMAIRLAQSKGFYEEMETKTKSLCTPLTAFLEKHRYKACVQQAGSMWTLFFGVTSVQQSSDLPVNHEEYRTFYLWMLARGVYLPMAQNEACFLSSAHTQEQIDMVRELIFEYFSRIYKNNLSIKE